MGKLLHRVRLSVSVSALITLGIGLALTALLFGSLRRIESQSAKVRFEQSASLRGAAVAAGMNDAVEQLLVLNNLFRSMGVVSREQFRVFSAPLLVRYPEIQALSFQRLVTQAERPAYENAMRRQAPGFVIRETVDGQRRAAPERALYNVTEYIEPAAGNDRALGLDTALVPEQAAARQRARLGDVAVATGLLTLDKQQDWRTGFLVLAPVYRAGAALDSAAARMHAVIGETTAVFRADRLIHTILGAGGWLDVPGMAIAIYASAETDPRHLAFRHGAETSPSADTPSLLPRWLLYDTAPPRRTAFTMAGNAWHIEVSQAPLLFSARHGGSLYALLGGILSSLLACAYIYDLVSRTATIERVAGKRTASLEFANLRLSEDLALRIHSEKSLRIRERVIEVSANAILICSATGPDYAIEYVNPAFERITGYSALDVLGRNLECLQGGSQDQQNLEEIRAALRDKREGHVTLRNYRKDGTAYWNDLFIAPVRDENELISHFVVAQYDITSVLRFEQELEFQALHDSLTGLANRRLLRDRLGQAIASAERSGEPLWVLFLDIDRFKYVNDTLGHEAGDALLRTLAQRLQAATREPDTVARLGGDEFVLVLPYQADSDSGSGLETLQRVMEAVALPLLCGEHEFFLTCSVGVATYPADGGTAESLIKNADIAMYRAKEMGRSNFQFYAATMNQRTLERLGLENALRHALERGQFSLVYQPQVNLRSGRIVGMEALIRWQHPQLGAIAPSRFIGLAEEMGLIVPIGAWVLRTACAQAKAWQDAGLGGLRVAVNLSARQFAQKNLAQSIAVVLQETGLEARWLELELTESMVMSDVDNAIEILRTLKELGIHIAIDDFGTGYSSLSYLRRFPIDVLKIDQSFVRDSAAHADDAAIVRAIISLAHSLRLSVIAEGVETADQLAFLQRHGCDQIQGYHFSRPLAPEAFAQLLQSGHTLDGARSLAPA